jgi:Ca2+-binding RTX toxin-like protein
MLLRGTEGADVLTGAGEDDTIYGFGGADTLRGGAGDDVLAGNEGNDKLYGGDGDDYILGGPGDDLIDGGAGNDWAAYEDATAGVTVDLTKTGAQNTGGGGRDTLVGIENVYGSDFNDTLIGNAENNMLVGGKGADTLSGGKGDDTLWGSEGNDTLDGGDGDDYLVGGAGDDIIKGGAGWDWSSYEDATAGVTVDLTKTGQQDTIGAGKDTLSGIEHLYGSKFNDVLTGDAGDNYLWGDAGDDKLYGGKGDDHLSGGAGVNIIDGGEGWDTVDYAWSDKGVTINLSGAPAPQISIPPGVDTLISIEAAMGSAHNDYIVGNDAENYLFGDAGDDVIFGIGGHDTLDGGDGNDILRGSFRKPGDLLLGGAGNDQIIVWTGEGSEGDATIVDGGTGVDSLIFSSYYDITLDLRITGDQLISPGVHMVVSNIENVMGSYGNDRITGDAGNNVIIGGAGNDVLDGGAGFDIASYEGDKAVRVDLSKTGPQDTGGAGVDTLSNFEGLKGSLKADILIGDAKDNTFEGGLGDDIIDGGAGNDTAIYIGNANQYTWSRNANGTWTVKGLEGVDTLLNIEKLQFRDQTVTLSPSATTVTVDDLVGGTKVLVSSGDVRDAVLSADGLTAYVATGDGHVKAIDVISGVVRADIKVGTVLGGMDVSADGRYVVFTEGMLVDRSSPGGSPAPMAAVHILDLQTGAVRDYARFVNGAEHSFKDAAFTNDGKVILTQNSLTGYTAAVTLDPVSGTFTSGTARYANTGVLSVTDDRDKVLLSERVLHIVTPGEGEVAHSPAYPGDRNSYGGIQAISGDGSKIAQMVYPQTIHVYDAGLNHLVDLGGLIPRIGFIPTISSVKGMDFSADGKELFLALSVGQILKVSTTTWTLEEVYAMPKEAIVDPNVYAADNVFGNALKLSDDGSRMLITNGASVVSIAVASLQPFGGTAGADVMTGTRSDDVLRGFDGDDTLSGNEGNDTLVGGRGADTLTGGQGADTFVFAEGDSTWQMFADGATDVITDWEATDFLSFGPRAEYIHYGEATATNLLMAKTIAPQIMATRNLSYLAMQVENDVYVFAAPSGLANGASETVVKLANTTLDKISIDNFLPVGDAGNNLLIGGALGDTLNGLAGNDVIRGGKGSDRLIGGAGNDIFQFETGDSVAQDPNTAQGVDVIMDFSPGDRLEFDENYTGTVSLSGGSAATYKIALDTAMANLAASPGDATRISALQVGSHTYVFVGHVDSTGAHLDNVVMLLNVSSGTIQMDSFVMGGQVLTGTAQSEMITGTVGDDVITGGKGADILIGGPGHDLFQFAIGDSMPTDNSGASVDVIMDFQVGDEIRFLGKTLPVSFGTYAADSFAAAQTLANTLVHAAPYNQLYMAFQVGADTYVFAGQNVDASGQAIENVIKLQGVSTSLLTIDSFY